MNFRKLRQTSLLKTIRFNVHYFGLAGLKGMPVLVARNYFFRSLGGVVILDSPRRFGVQLGFPGTGTTDQRYTRGCWEVDGEVEFRGGAFFGHGSAVSVGKRGRLVVGDRFSNTARSSFICQKEMTFGSGCSVSWDTQVMDSDFHSIDGAEADAPIRIGDDVWIGCRATVLKGSVIPDGCVIGAGALITKPLPEAHAAYGGTNRLLKSNVAWSRKPSNYEDYQ